MTSDNYVKVSVAICTTSALEDPVYILVPNVSNLNVKMVENYGETGTFQIINILDDPKKNLLSSQCEGWSDGNKRKIDQTMFIRLYHGERSESVLLGVYKITTITASAETLTVEFCDSLQFLRSQGADYVYNHYKGAYAWHKTIMRWNNNRAEVTKPSNIPIIGSLRKDIKVIYVTDWNEHGDNTHSMSVNDGITCFIPRSAYTGDYLKEIRYINFSGWTVMTSRYIVRIGHSEGSSDIINDEFTQYSNFDWNKTFDVASNPSKYYVPNGFWVYIDTDHAIGISTRQTDISGAKARWGRDQTWTYNVAIKMDIRTEKETDNVTGSEDSSDHTKWVVNTVDDKTISESMVDVWDGNAQIYYADAIQPMPNTTIIHDILAAFDMTTDIKSGIGSRDVSVFRCNGDLTHNYLLALADMLVESSNRQFVMYADRSQWGKISVRNRYRKEDTAVKTLAYAKDNVSGATVFESFNPSISLRDHPNLAVVKSSDESDHPIMVAISDPNISVGATNPIVSSKSTDVVSAALEAYSAIITNRSNQWSGEMVIPFILQDFFKRDSSTINGGIPVRITDSRYGMSNYQAKVKEVKWDLANQTTTITLNNYSEVYSNGLVDTTKMAYTSGGLSAESTNTDMFTRQFVNLKTNAVFSGTPTVKLLDRDGNVTGTASAENVAVIRIPELNIGVINAYFPYGQGTASERHGIYAVKINNTKIDIQQYRRPDKDESESLIVNVIYKLSR